MNWYQKMLISLIGKSFGLNLGDIYKKSATWSKENPHADMKRRYDEIKNIVVHNSEMYHERDYILSLATTLILFKLREEGV